MAKSRTLELSIRIAGEMDKSLRAALRNSQDEISSFSRGMSSIATAGLAAISALSAGTVAAIATCTNEAAKYENYMSDVVKVVDGLADASGKVSNLVVGQKPIEVTMKEALQDPNNPKLHTYDEGGGITYADNYALMKETLKDLSTQIPYTFEDLTRLAAAAGQSGKTFEDLTKTDFLKHVAMWGTAMDISADQAGDWGAKWEQAFNMNHEQVMDIADVINYLGNNYATTAAEIANSVNDSASLGQLAGVDVKATAAIAASMQAMGVSSDKVGTSIKRIYTNITKGSSETAAQERAFARLGISAKGIAKAMQADGTGTLLSVFEAINKLPEAEKLSTLNDLFGQWALEGGAKITQNLSLLEGMLREVSDESLWRGSMEKEFIIKATTPEAINTMLGSAKSALMDDIGSVFLPAYKDFGVKMIDFIGQLRDMPELSKVTDKLGELASNGVQKLGEALDNALPYIQKGLDYLLNNGDKVAEVIGGLATAFLGMKFAPAAEGLLRGAGGLLFGKKIGGSGHSRRRGGLMQSLQGVYTSGRDAGSAGVGAVRSFVNSFGNARTSNGFLHTLGVAASGLISGNGLTGTAGLLSAAANSPGITSGFLSPVGAIRNAVSNSGVGQLMGRWTGGITASAGNVGSALRNSGVGRAGAGLMSNIANSNAVRTVGGALNTVTMPVRKGLAGLGATAVIRGNVIQQGMSGIAGRAGGLVNGIRNSGVGNIVSSGFGLMSSAWGPMAGGFASILGGALPIVGVISSIIAVVSILGDNLEGIRNIVGNVFGEQGLVVFDKFTGALTNVGNFISGLFVDGGVATALSGFRDMLFGEGGIFAGNETAAGAFDGIVQIIQSVMGVVGQLVSFSTTTVKPIIEGLFNFITQTVVPIILQTITAAAPYISSIISGVGSAIMTVAEIIGQAILAAMPIIKNLATFMMNIGQVVLPAVLSGISIFADGFKSVIDGVKTILEGIITFITGVFSGDWEKAWEGVKSIFGGVFDTLGALFKTPINAVISLINKAISGINGLGLKIPDWVPILGGKNFAINIPEIPMLAKGGFTTGPSIAGEAGTEAVISFQRGVRQENIRTWAMAGRMLGVGQTQLQDIPDGALGHGGGGGITFAPQIIIQGNADRSVIDEALAEARAQFETWYLQMQRRQVRTAY